MKDKANIGSIFVYIWNNMKQMNICLEFMKTMFLSRIAYVIGDMSIHGYRGRKFSRMGHIFMTTSM